MIINPTIYKKGSGGFDIEGKHIWLPAEEGYIPSAGEFVNFNLYGGANSIGTKYGQTPFDSCYIKTDDDGNKYYAIMTHVKDATIFTASNPYGYIVQVIKLSPNGCEVIGSVPSIARFSTYEVNYFYGGVTRIDDNTLLFGCYHNLEKIIIDYDNKSLAKESILNIGTERAQIFWDKVYKIDDDRYFSIQDIEVVLLYKEDNEWKKKFYNFGAGFKQSKVLQVTNNTFLVAWRYYSSGSSSYKYSINLSKIEIGEDNTISSSKLVLTSKDNFATGSGSADCQCSSIDLIDDNHIIVTWMDNNANLHPYQFHLAVYDLNLQEISSIYYDGGTNPSPSGTRIPFVFKQITVAKISKNKYIYSNPSVYKSVSTNKQKLFIFEIDDDYNIKYSSADDIKIDETIDEYTKSYLYSTYYVNTQCQYYPNSENNFTLFCTSYDADTSVHCYNVTLNKDDSLTFNNIAMDTKIQKAHSLSYPCGITTGETQVDAYGKATYEVVVPE